MREKYLLKKTKQTIYIHRRTQSISLTFTNSRADVKYFCILFILRRYYLTTTNHLYESLPLFFIHYAFNDNIAIFSNLSRLNLNMECRVWNVHCLPFIQGTHYDRQQHWSVITLQPHPLTRQDLYYF